MCADARSRRVQDAIDYAMEETAAGWKVYDGLIKTLATKNRQAGAGLKQ